MFLHKNIYSNHYYYNIEMYKINITGIILNNYILLWKKYMCACIIFTINFIIKFYYNFIINLFYYILYNNCINRKELQLYVSLNELTIEQKTIIGKKNN